MNRRGNLSLTVESGRYIAHGIVIRGKLVQFIIGNDLMGIFCCNYNTVGIDFFLIELGSKIRIGGWIYILHLNMLRSRLVVR